MNKSVKKILVTGASLLMMASVGAGIGGIKANARIVDGVLVANNVPNSALRKGGEYHAQFVFDLIKSGWYKRHGHHYHHAIRRHRFHRAKRHTGNIKHHHYVLRPAHHAHIRKARKHRTRQPHKVHKIHAKKTRRTRKNRKAGIKATVKHKNKKHIRSHRNHNSVNKNTGAKVTTNDNTNNDDQNNYSNNSISYAPAKSLPTPNLQKLASASVPNNSNTEIKSTSNVQAPNRISDMSSIKNEANSINNNISHMKNIINHMK